MKCMIQDALGLGYVCGNKNLNYLHKWFIRDTLAAKLIDDCKQFPMGAKLNKTFISIDYKINNDTIRLISKASAMLMDDVPETWDWEEYYKFKIYKYRIAILSIAKSEVIHKFLKNK